MNLNSHKTLCLNKAMDIVMVETEILAMKEKLRHLVHQTCEQMKGNHGPQIITIRNSHKIPKVMQHLLTQVTEMVVVVEIAILAIVEELRHQVNQTCEQVLGNHGQQIIDSNRF